MIYRIAIILVRGSHLVTFDEIQPGGQILVHDEVGLLHDSGGHTNGKLILTQIRLVFVIGGGFFERRYLGSF